LHHEFCRPALAAPEGVRNKFTQELKQTILDAMHNANDEADRGTGAAARIIPSRCLAGSTTPVEVILHRVRSGRPLCANSGHCPTAWRTGQIDPKATFRFDAMDGWKAGESGPQLKP